MKFSTTTRVWPTSFSLKSAMDFLKEPYREGWNNILEGIFPQTPVTNLSAFQFFKQRAVLIIKGIALLIPCVNLVIQFACSYFRKKASIPSSPLPAVVIQNSPVILPPQDSLSNNNNHTASNQSASSINVEAKQEIAEKKSFATIEDLVKGTREKAELVFIDKADLCIEVTKIINLLGEVAREIVQSNSSAEVDSEIIDNLKLELEIIRLEIDQIKHIVLFEIQEETEASAWLKNILKELHIATKPTQDFKVLLKIGLRHLNVRFKSLFGGTFLHMVSKHRRYLDYIPLIVSQGIDLSLKDFWGNTALMWACANACNKNAMAILEKGGKGEYLDIQCSNGNTALHLIVGKGYTTHDSDKNPLKYSNHQLLSKALSLEANVNLKNVDGNTPLHLACLRRDPEMIQALIEAGADPEIKNNAEEKPAAMFNKQCSAAREILEKTVRVFTLDQTVYTPRGLNYAFQAFQLSINKMNRKESDNNISISKIEI